MGTLNSFPDKVLIYTTMCRTTITVFSCYSYTVVHLLIGVEKNNDVARRNYFSSNLHDPAGEILKAEGRFEVTEHHKRQKRKYTKRDDEYWINGGIQENRKCRRVTDISNCM